MDRDRLLKKATFASLAVFLVNWFTVVTSKSRWRVSSNEPYYAWFSAIMWLFWIHVVWILKRILLFFFHYFYCYFKIASCFDLIENFFSFLILNCWIEWDENSGLVWLLILKLNKKDAKLSKKRKIEAKYSKLTRNDAKLKKEMQNWTKRRKTE